MAMTRQQRKILRGRVTTRSQTATCVAAAILMALIGCGKPASTSFDVGGIDLDATEQEILALNEGYTCSDDKYASSSSRRTAMEYGMPEADIPPSEKLATRVCHKPCMDASVQAVSVRMWRDRPFEITRKRCPNEQYALGHAHDAYEQRLGIKIPLHTGALSLGERRGLDGFRVSLDKGTLIAVAESSSELAPASAPLIAVVWSNAVAEREMDAAFQQQQSDSLRLQRGDGSGGRL